MRYTANQRSPWRGLSLTLLALGLCGALPGRAQDSQSQPQQGGWRRFGDPPPLEAQQQQPVPPPNYQTDARPEEYPQQSAPPSYQPATQPPYRPDPQYQPGPQQPPQPVDVPMAPPTLTLAPGTWITVRLNQPLSSDHNQPGDAFTATLVQPLIVNGLVIARRGETVGGRVAEVEKAGRVQGTSRINLELTEVRFVDGQQVPVHTQLVGRRGDTSQGQDVAAIGATTGIGAAIGAAAGGGFGAGMGAIAGAGAATIGILSTRGRGTYVGPESVLTFRLAEPITISTERSPYAFQPVTQQDYSSPSTLQQRPGGYGPPRMANGAPYGGAYYGGVAPRPYPYYAAPYPYWYGPSYYGPSLYIYSGPRYYGRYRRW